ncbi:TIGR02678 family protein [Thermobifida halotolerans]|uniref:TIGR02678 family protein n=1 Tax=Thermobifida halotolerans TaxID=483545 RepID=A0A399G1D7_9ACTN|nr:TIGR02678 family protein [Thermobifida halotolerans]UOE18388.1 TIGR02678 family protein [Thermobifida halotolerans]
MAAKEDIALTIERQAAARRLLTDPLITARSHPEDFALVHAHSDWLIRRFQRVLGYELVVADDHARLVKTGLVHTVATPLHRDSGAPFTPRAYTYLTLTLAALADADPRTTVAELASGVRAAARDAGLDIDPRSRLGERRAFVAGLTRLVAWGALTETSGSLADYATDGTREVALDVDHGVAAHVLARAPHSTTTPEDFIDLTQSDAVSSDARAVELTLRRLLAETAVIYRTELDTAHRARLAGHQWRAAAELAELLGCDTEVRAEGVALIMPGDTAADARGAEQPATFPGPGPVGQAALTLLSRLATMLAPPSFSHAVPIPAELLDAELASVVDDDTRQWSRTVLSHVPDPDDLAARVLQLLRDSRLLDRVAVDADHPTAGWRLLAAAARYRDSAFPRSGAE